MLQNAPLTVRTIRHETEEQILKTEIIGIERKAFKVELRSNANGRFLKITEIVKTGRRDQIIIPVAGLARFPGVFEEMMVLCLVPPPGTLPPKPRHQNAEISADRKFFELALRENHRGPFVKITEMISRHYVSAIMVPASGLGELKRVFVKMIEAAAL